MEISKVQQGFLLGIGFGIIWGILIYQLILTYKGVRAVPCPPSPPTSLGEIQPVLPNPGLEARVRIPTISVGRSRNMVGMMVEATAYTAGKESTGKTPAHPAYGLTKSGYRADIGTIAVDPTVIPLGSVVWVEGYGYAVALDVGGKIKGERIDVFFHDVAQAKAWGRRKVRIRILGGVIDEYH